MKQNESVSYLMEHYPLVKVFEYDEQNYLVFDARPNMMFILSKTDLAILVAYLETDDRQKVKKLFHKDNDMDPVLDMIDTLKQKGVLLKGPLDYVISDDEKEVRDRIEYNLQNIFMRKYILETTQQCNFRCLYCHNTIEPVFRHHTSKKMELPVAKKAVDFYFELYTNFFNRLPDDKKKIMLKHYHPSIGFYGGEPSLNWELVVKAVEYYKSLPWEEHGIPIESLNFTVNTNLYHLTDDMISFLIKHNPYLYISLDGPKSENDKNRLTVDGKGTFDRVYANIMRIKQASPDYFKDRVMLLCVEAEGNDIERVHDFIDKMGCLVDYLPVSPYGCIVKDPDKEIAAIEETEDEWIKNKLSAYNKKVSNGDKDALSEFTSLYFMEHVMTNTPFKQRKLNLSLTCPMCIDNIMIGTEGEIHICHKTDGSLPLGNVVTGGYDMEKMYEANRSYAELTNCQECRSCWAVNNCNYCAAMRLDGGRWKNPAKRECDVLRRNAESIFKLFIAVYKQDPQIISDLFLYKNDMNNYTSILDYNEFIHYEYPTKEESVHPTNGVKKDI